MSKYMILERSKSFELRMGMEYDMKIVAWSIENYGASSVGRPYLEVIQCYVDNTSQKKVIQIKGGQGCPKKKAHLEELCDDLFTLHESYVRIPEGQKDTQLNAIEEYAAKSLNMKLEA